MHGVEVGGGLRGTLIPKEDGTHGNSAKGLVDGIIDGIVALVVHAAVGHPVAKEVNIVAARGAAEWRAQTVGAA
eukprot:scaffold10113_cov150-Isochrysis_galbana.AAC.6